MHNHCDLAASLMAVRFRTDDCSRSGGEITMGSLFESRPRQVPDRLYTRDSSITLMMRVLRGIALPILFMACGPTVSADGMAPIFGPKQYERSAGRPDQFTDS